MHDLHGDDHAVGNVFPLVLVKVARAGAGAEQGTGHAAALIGRQPSGQRHHSLSHNTLALSQLSDRAQLGCSLGHKSQAARAVRSAPGIRRLRRRRRLAVLTGRAYRYHYRGRYCQLSCGPKIRIATPRSSSGFLRKGSGRSAQHVPTFRAAEAASAVVQSALCSLTRGRSWCSRKACY